MELGLGVSLAAPGFLCHAEYALPRSPSGGEIKGPKTNFCLGSSRIDIISGVSSASLYSLFSPLSPDLSLGRYCTFPPPLLSAFPLQLYLPKIGRAFRGTEELSVVITTNILSSYLFLCIMKIMPPTCLVSAVAITFFFKYFSSIFYPFTYKYICGLELQLLVTNQNRWCIFILPMIYWSDLFCNTSCSHFYFLFFEFLLFSLLFSSAQYFPTSIKNRNFTRGFSVRATRLLLRSVEQKEALDNGRSM